MVKLIEFNLSTYHASRMNIVLLLGLLTHSSYTSNYCFFSLLILFNITDMRISTYNIIVNTVRKEIYGR